MGIKTLRKRKYSVKYEDPNRKVWVKVQGNRNRGTGIWLKTVIIE